MKLSTKKFKERYPFWIPFAKAFFLFHDCEFNSILEVSAILNDNSHIYSYFVQYPDTFGFPFEKLSSCLIRRYSYSEYKSDLSHLISFVQSLNEKQFDYFLDKVYQSHIDNISFVSFLTHKYHEIKR